MVSLPIQIMIISNTRSRAVDEAMKHLMCTSTSVLVIILYIAMDDFSSISRYGPENVEKSKNVIFAPLGGQKISKENFNRLALLELCSYIVKMRLHAKG